MITVVSGADSDRCPRQLSEAAKVAIAGCYYCHRTHPHYRLLCPRQWQESPDRKILLRLSRVFNCFYVDFRPVTVLHEFQDFPESENILLSICS
jgi:hypothetical protein